MSTNAISKVLTLELFRAWLEEQPRNSIVGNTCSGTDCPIARYLEEKGIKAPIVGRIDVTHTFDDDEHVYRAMLPDWAYRFVGELDKGNDEGTPVYRASALQFLDEATNDY